MKPLISLVFAGLLTASAALAQQGGAPSAGSTGSADSAAQFGSSPGSAAQSGSSPPQQMQPNGSTPAGEPAVSGNSPGRGNTGNSGTFGSGGAWITGPGNGGGVAERRDRVITRENGLTTGRADRGGCTTQVYRVPSEASGDTTSVSVVRC
jgi:hypothetical protein